MVHSDDAFADTAVGGSGRFVVVVLLMALVDLTVKWVIVPEHFFQSRLGEVVRRRIGYDDGLVKRNEAHNVKTERQGAEEDLILSLKSGEEVLNYKKITMF